MQKIHHSSSDTLHRGDCRLRIQWGRSKRVFWLFCLNHTTFGSVQPTCSIPVKQWGQLSRTRGTAPASLLAVVRSSHPVHAVPQDPHELAWPPLLQEIAHGEVLNSMTLCTQIKVKTTMLVWKYSWVQKLRIPPADSATVYLMIFGKIDSTFI